MDSLQFLTMRLKDMPKTFGVQEVKKCFFLLPSEQSRVLGQGQRPPFKRRFRNTIHGQQRQGRF